MAAPEQPILAAIADAQPIDFAAMAAAQRSCTEVAEMMNSTTLQITTQAVGDELLLGDISTGVFRPLVPIQHKEAVFQSLHAIHHPVVRATSRLITARFCWPQMAKAITLMARACLHCQGGKVHKHVHLQPAEIPVPHRRFAHIHVDLVGPLPFSRVHTYLFTIIDRTSIWPEAIPLTSITAADCARALSPAGYCDLESQPPSHQTEGPNSGPPYGRACTACPTSNTHPRQHSTLNQTDWSSGSTGG
jgi:hypothetical protein